MLWRVLRGVMGVLDAHWVVIEEVNNNNNNKKTKKNNNRHTGKRGTQLLTGHEGHLFGTWMTTAAQPLR